MVTRNRSKNRGDARPRRRPAAGQVALWSVVLPLWLLLSPGAVSAQENRASVEMELTTPVRQELRRLQDRWQDWTSAYFQNDEEQARNALSQLLTVADNLGMEKLSDQSVAGAAFAVRSAREGNFERARWAVDCARQLDPGRPEADFAGATVERLAGNYPGILTSSVRGYRKLFALPLEGHIWKQNLGVGAIYVLMAASGFFLLLLMASRGADLFHDLGRLVPSALPRAAADGAALAALLWPIVLPSGVFWLALYWSILLWGYGTWSQRVVLVFLWVALALSPAAIALHQQEVRGSLVPPIRALENLEAKRLYGSLFLDIEILRGLQPDSAVVTELIADLHRDLGQWEHARVIYDRMQKDYPGSPQAASAINNIGVYLHRSTEFATAAQYFTQAIAADPNLTEGHYNLSRSYFDAVKFPEGHRALADAKRSDPATVTQWEKTKAERPGGVVPTQGGLRKVGEIRQALELTGTDSEPQPLLSHARPALGAALGAVVLAVALHFARRRKGYPSSKFTGTSELAGNRWLKAAVPGWASTRRGQGLPAFLAALFLAAVLLVPVLPDRSYRTSLGFDAGPGLATLLCWVTLVLFFAVRLGLALRAVESHDERA